MEEVCGAVGMGVLAVTGALTALNWAYRRAPPSFDARGRVVLVTGASSGIGEELAYQYAALGARLVLCARREAELQRVEAEVKRRTPGAEVLLVRCDVAVPEDCRRLAREAEGRFGALDLVLLNAGVSQNCKFEAVDSVDDYRHMFRVNVFGVIDVLHHALPLLLRSPVARVAVVSSVAGKVGVPNRTGYSASKFALQGFCDALRFELRPRGVAVTLICPGTVQTNINNTRLGSEKGTGFSMERAQPVDDAGRQIVAAVRRGDREAVVGFPLFRFKVALLSAIRPLAPWFIDSLIIKNAKAVGLLQPDDPADRAFGSARLGGDKKSD